VRIATPRGRSAKGKAIAWTLREATMPLTPRQRSYANVYLAGVKGAEREDPGL